MVGCSTMGAAQWWLLIVALQWELICNGSCSCNGCCSMSRLVALHNGSCSMVVAQWLVALQWELLIMVVALQWLLYNGLLLMGCSTMGCSTMIVAL